MATFLEVSGKKGQIYYLSYCENLVKISSVRPELFLLQGARRSIRCACRPLFPIKFHGHGNLVQLRSKLWPCIRNNKQTDRHTHIHTHSVLCI